MKTIKNIESKDQQKQMANARKYGAKEGENNNPYKALKPAVKAYRKSYK